MWKHPGDAGFSVQLDRVQFAANILGVFGMLLASLQPNVSPNFDQCEVLDCSIDNLIWYFPNAWQVLPRHVLHNPQLEVILDWFSGLSAPLAAPQMTWIVIFPFPKKCNQEYILITAL